MDLRKFVKALTILGNPLLSRGLILNGVAGAVEHLKIIEYVRPAHLIDVGANKGQFTLATLSVMPQVRIDCFEPLPQVADSLERLAKRISPRVQIHRVALSDSTGSSQFFVASREDSSSLFRPARAQERVGIEVKKKITVETDRLDNILESDAVFRPSLLKIDVQGGELNVLKGLGLLTDVIDYIYLEVSFIELYENQPLFAIIYDYLNACGFAFRGIGNCDVDGSRGPAQADALFCRKGLEVKGLL